MIAMTLINISIIGACTFLAWHFGKWWIILFCPLLMLTYKNERRADDEND